MNQILNEAKRLHDLGFGLLVLHPKQKRPKGNEWAKGPRKTWDEFKSIYNDGDNLGVRLGEASMVGKNYLACIDVDIKDPNYKTVAQSKLLEILKSFGTMKMPIVESGSGGGSKHLYFTTTAPFKMVTAAKEKGKFEICIYSNGRQMVLAPSIHPNGRPYKWRTPLMKKSDLPVIDAAIVESLNVTNNVTNETGEAVNVRDTKDTTTIKDFTFKPVPVDVELIPMSKTIEGMLTKGIGVTDRSGALLPVSSALLRAGLTQDEVLSLLTDKKHFLGKVAYDHTDGNDRARAAFWVYRYTLKKVIADLAREREQMFASPVVEPRELSFDEMTEQENFLKKFHDWRDDLDQTEKGSYKSNIKNVIEIIRNDESLGPDLIKRDLFALRDFYERAAPWGGVAGAAMTDDDVAKMKNWFSRHYGFEPNTGVLEAAIVVVATDNQFDPVVDWIRSLPPWDEVPRLDTWLVKHFNAEGGLEYLSQVFRKWVCAMVLRIIKPGAKFDWMPIFEGGQGVGKSSFGRLLVGDKYFLDWLPDLNNKDSALSLQGIWAVEMGELTQFRKNELEAVKAYITRTVDKFRPPHGRKNIEVPRRCVFFGTTNHDTYLRDETGNRRFKPVKVGKLNFDQLKEDRLQLFAEALWLLDTGFESESTLDLDGDARIFEHQFQNEKMVLDESHLMEERLLDFFEKQQKNPDQNGFTLDRFSMEHLFVKGSGPLVDPPLSIWKFEGRFPVLAARALVRLGYSNKLGMINGRKVWRKIKEK
jgi:predicted P-loop ATPase